METFMSSESHLFDVLRQSRLHLDSKFRFRPNIIELSVLRWGDSTESPAADYASVSTVQANPVYQSLVASGTERGGVTLFRNEFSSQASVNRTMPRHVLRCSKRSSSEAHRKAVTSLRFMEEHVLASASLDGFIRVWDCTNASSGQEVASLASRDGISSMEVVRCFGDNAVLVTGTDAGHLHLRDLRSKSGQGDKTAKSQASAITSICMDTTYTIISGNTAGEVEIRDLRSLRPTPTLKLNGSKEAQNLSHVRAVKELPKIGRRATAEISDDLWDIAMGKSANKRSLKAKTRPESSPVNVPVRRAFENAHGGRVVYIGFREPGQIITVAQDRDCNIFCGNTGSLLRTIKLKDKPLDSAYINRTLFVGERNGLRVLMDNPAGFEEAQGLSNPHMGSVTAIAQCAEWGICTGGNDAHVFVHGL